MSLRKFALGVPGVRLALKAWRRRNWTSGSYWEQRYARGRTSGAGSYGRLADFKAEVLNQFVTDNHVHSVVEMGCGDGNQLSLARYPHYVGLDVSPTAIERCREKFAQDPSKTFRLYVPGTAVDVRGELGLSLDVIFHLLEDEVFEDYMRTLFSVSERFVAIYSSDYDQRITGWRVVRHRQFSTWISNHASDWTLTKQVSQRYPIVGTKARETSFSDFFFYTKAG